MKINPYLNMIAIFFAVSLGLACSRPAKDIQPKKNVVENSEEDPDRDDEREEQNDKPKFSDSTPSQQGDDSNTPKDSQSKPKLSLKEILAQTGWDGKSNQSFVDGWEIQKVQ